MDPILSAVMASLEGKCLPVARGTFLADVIVVCLVARPQLPTQLKRRRLALALVPKPGVLNARP